MPAITPPRKTAAHRFSPVILRAYDIRGIAGTDLSEADAHALGLAFGSLVRRDETKGGEPRICAGRDGRLSSPALAQALMRGLAETGALVEDIGIGPSPMLYFAVRHREADAGIMVTGSHNPAEYNGFKMTLRSGPVFGERIRTIGEIAASGAFETGAGAVHEIDIRADYLARLLQDHTGIRPLKVAWDAGNGAAGEILHRLVRRLPGEHIVLFGEIDGRFPHHHPDPAIDANLADLRRAVLENGCDLGIAFDGDGDRIGVVDEKGEILRSDILMTLYARQVLEACPGAAIIGDVKCSQVMFDEIARLGGRPVMWKTGHSPIKAKMAETGAKLAGELSGHISFADRYYGFDDALYCAVRLLGAVCAAGGPLSALTRDLPRLYNTPEIRIGVDEERKFSIVPEILESLRPALPAGTKVSTIDGIRVSGPDGWWLLRPSNTQAALTFRAESPTPEGLERLKNMALHEMEKLGYSLDPATA